MRPQPIPPQPGQESVWDYPRPAIWQDVSQPIKIIFNGEVIAETQQAKRVLETSHPPAYYIPAEDIKLEYLIETPRITLCEWKGRCVYYEVKLGDKHVYPGAWRYFDPTPNFVPIKDSYGFYANVMDACYVGDELVTPQPGNFYAGWITKNIVGPFKGEPGTMGW
ncbi:DUF427 domain-containing protein [Limnoraphis robusta Tam1]|jgi:uncharacterized protein (DUF427 family)|uniref:DUF427 domain-containing protein n=1 Tax=Limnoraphis robusta CCNP1315 TaxID=3110306 RepID=A0ABU5U1S7_9CYAN|nr:DUF427 domain-containing protein [Limnoraphis robusta]MCG5059416.1 DUF427 domain-containing protein [Limnoraphis sp. WC205]MEA5500884.1 DUF427 domain-containing protein [Limnoraphis robusta BA-68 BA1]MEA5521147.1 DUF427 domain-containing protein [Limnoraphis robusta CCNP1315]MEA5537972.1 DUF427 domain-containing protein [Limnoraphis robusta Tam1]MEA5546703.1 DUF427 domain-containing protein [Limnoraphis robusta CCNP1324]